jgi:hypothetical protein
MKIRSVGSELLLAERHDEGDSRFSQFFLRARKVRCGVFISDEIYDVTYNFCYVL